MTQSERHAGPAEKFPIARSRETGDSRTECGAIGSGNEEVEG